MGRLAYRRVRPVRALRWLAVALAAAGSVSGAARAQHGLGGHGLVPPEERPLHQRLARAQRVALATVAAVGVGRIDFEDARPVVGRVEPAFQVKRAPSRPPPVEVGDRVLLLLRGARPPYVWVDRPGEVTTFPDAAEAARWVEAVQALDAVRTDGESRRALYARWTDEGPESLRVEGLRGLLDPAGAALLRDEDFIEGRVAVARDRARPAPARRAAARVAARHAAGVAGLLEHLAEVGPAVDPEIARIALQAGLAARVEGVEARLIELMDAAPTELRGDVVRMARHARGEAVEQGLARVATTDREDLIRQEAVRSLDVLRRRRSR